MRMSKNGTLTDKRRLTATEKEALQRLNIALEILTKEKDNLAARAAMIPGAKRDMAMMAAKIEKLMGEMVLTIPDEQLATYVRALKMVSYTIGVKNPFRQTNEKDYGMWLPFDVINGLLEGCHDHCMMCNLDRVGRMRCRFRKTLDTIPNDVVQWQDGDCPYYTVI